MSLRCNVIFNPCPEVRSTDRELLADQCAFNPIALRLLLIASPFRQAPEDVAQTEYERHRAAGNRLRRKRTCNT